MEDEHEEGTKRLSHGWHVDERKCCNEHSRIVWGDQNEAGEDNVGNNDPDNHSIDAVSHFGGASLFFRVELCLAIAPRQIIHLCDGIGTKGANHGREVEVVGKESNHEPEHWSKLQNGQMREDRQEKHKQHEY